MIADDCWDYFTDFMDNNNNIFNKYCKYFDVF